MACTSFRLNRPNFRLHILTWLAVNSERSALLVSPASHRYFSSKTEITSTAQGQNPYRIHPFPPLCSLTKPRHHLLYDLNRVGNLSHRPSTPPPSFPKEKSTQRTTSIRKNTYCMILFIRQSRESKIELWGRKSESSCLVEGKGWWFSWLERE